ncbi:carbohydrate porin [Seonamhaeicola maritimus]|uniref:Carbohydrate porin n=1 Tax=Seonamhaeicola maritimus TaxID=2591822 RepID=A0A5C7GGI5_9FLAO|nr:carbohydrate porin [Seonamhaeicola maritimus]TXG36776.1 carbohydrate porin [Seonamhaeicola maritimus]
MKKLILLGFAFASFSLMGQEKEASKTHVKIETSGIDSFISYASIAAANISGGLDHASRYAGQLYTGFKLDFEKILGWKGTRGKVSMINRHGAGLSNEVGSVFEPLNIVGGQSTFLYDLSIEKDFGDQFSLKAGRTTSVDDFMVSKLYFYALNNTVNGVIRALLLDGNTTTFPFATWGSRLKFKPNSKHQIQLGVYQLSKTVFDETLHGLDFAFRSSDDLSVFFQYDWFGKMADHKTRVYIGANQVFGSLANFDSIETSDYFFRLYGHMDIDLTDNLTSFLTMAYSPHGEVAKLPFQSSFGINWKGPIKSRTEDRMLFFATIGTFSDEWQTLQDNDLSSEIVLELGYRFQITNYFVLQPALQYDIRPGGMSTIDNAVIPGLWIEANF